MPQDYPNSPSGSLSFPKMPIHGSFFSDDIWHIFILRNQLTKKIIECGFIDWIERPLNDA